MCCVHFVILCTKECLKGGGRFKWNFGVSNCSDLFPNRLDVGYV